MAESVKRQLKVRPFFGVISIKLTNGCRVLMDNFSPSQYDRFESYRRHALPKQAVRKVGFNLGDGFNLIFFQVIQQTLGYQVSQPVAQIIAGFSKVFVGEIVEQGKYSSDCCLPISGKASGLTAGFLVICVCSSANSIVCLQRERFKCVGVRLGPYRRITFAKLIGPINKKLVELALLDH